MRGNLIFPPPSTSLQLPAALPERLPHSQNIVPYQRQVYAVSENQRISELEETCASEYLFWTEICSSHLLKTFLPTRQNPRAHWKSSEPYPIIFNIALYPGHSKGREGVIFDCLNVDLLPNVRQRTFCLLFATDLFPYVLIS